MKFSIRAGYKLSWWLRKTPILRGEKGLSLFVGKLSAKLWANTSYLPTTKIYIVGTGFLKTVPLGPCLDMVCMYRIENSG